MEKYAVIYLCTKNSTKIECGHFSDSNNFNFSTLKMAAGCNNLLTCFCIKQSINQAFTLRCRFMCGKVSSLLHSIL